MVAPLPLRLSRPGQGFATRGAPFLPLSGTVGLGVTGARKSVPLLCGDGSPENLGEFGRGYLMVFRL